MGTNYSTNRKFSRMLINILSIVAIVGLAFPITTVAYAISKSPFIGQWQAIDVDESDIRLTIAGRPDGPFQITWTESYISFCNGEAGLVRGTGQLNESDPNLLDADLHLECFTNDSTLDFQLEFDYHSNTNTLSSRWWTGVVTIWHRPGQQLQLPPTLNLRVYYGDNDWVESFYEAGHTAWVTVTENDGVTVKATADLITEPKDYWGGETGFQSLDSTWFDADGNAMEIPPDIQPYDWVYGWVDNGASAQVQIGDISGTIDLAADSVSGSIYVPWFSSEVNVECFPWGAPEPQPEMKFDTILPNGEDTYSCSWVGEWDIQPEQMVGVGYFGADGNWVANAFQVPNRNPRIFASAVGDWFWTTDFMPNSSLTLSIYESQEPGSILLWTGNRNVNEFGFVLVGYPDTSVDLAPGNYIIVSDGTFEKEIVLEWITVSMFDVKYDFMTGTAPAGSDVWVAAGPQDWQTGMSVTADPVTGAWTADFTTIPFNITEEMQPWSYAQIFDEDGDANEADPPPLEVWSAAYTYDAGTWSEGTHTYHFEAVWNSGSEIAPDVSFSVLDSAPSYNGYVLLRGLALRANIDGECPVIDPIIRSDQMTRFHNGYLTDYAMTYEEALTFFDHLSAKVVWDNGMSANLARHEIVPYSPDDWLQYVCTFTE